MLTQLNLSIYSLWLTSQTHFMAMIEVVWMSTSEKFFHLLLKLLQTFVETQQQLIKVTKELDVLKAKLASLEEEYGYDTVH